MRVVSLIIQSAGGFVLLGTVGTSGFFRLRWKRIEPPFGLALEHAALKLSRVLSRYPFRIRTRNVHVSLVRTLTIEYVDERSTVVSARYDLSIIMTGYSSNENQICWLNKGGYLFFGSIVGSDSYYNSPPAIVQ